MATKPKKKVEALIKLQVPAQAANPAPPVGPALGQHGVNIMEFCKSFNEKSADQEKGLPLPVVISVFGDRSFSFVIKTPPASVLIRKALGVAKGSSEPNKTKVGSLTQQQLQEIAEKKMPDINAYDVEQAMRIVAGTARSMGVTVES